MPLLLSVPHSGLAVPDYFQSHCRLTEVEIAADGDVGAREIYDLEPHVLAYVRTDIARAVLDMNRAVDDRRKDGVVKTHTCWDEPIWAPDPPEELFERVLREHHEPYHRQLSEYAHREDVILGLDCHTMAEFGPPVGPDPGVRRPLICIGDGQGASCPKEWVEAMRDCFAREFAGEVTINAPFAGGYITRAHGQEMPWMQIEMSRSAELSPAEKKAGFLRAIQNWCQRFSP